MSSTSTFSLFPELVATGRAIPVQACGDEWNSGVWRSCHWHLAGLGGKHQLQVSLCNHQSWTRNQRLWADNFLAFASSSFWLHRPATLGLLKASVSDLFVGPFRFVPFSVDGACILFNKAKRSWSLQTGSLGFWMKTTRGTGWSARSWRRWEVQWGPLVLFPPLKAWGLCWWKQKEEKVALCLQNGFLLRGSSQNRPIRGS